MHVVLSAQLPFFSKNYFELLSIVSSALDMYQTDWTYNGLKTDMKGHLTFKLAGSDTRPSLLLPPASCVLIGINIDQTLIQIIAGGHRYLEILCGFCIFLRRNKKTKKGFR